MLPTLPLVVLPPAASLPGPGLLPRPAFRSRYGGRGGGLPGARGGGSHPRVLIRVGCYVGDELLRRQREEPREGERGRGGG